MQVARAFNEAALEAKRKASAPGAKASATAAAAAAAAALPRMDYRSAAHLAHAYGDRAFEVLRIASERALQRPLVPGHPVMEAEVRRRRVALLNFYICVYLNGCTWFQVGWMPEEANGAHLQRIASGLSAQGRRSRLWVDPIPLFLVASLCHASCLLP